jgi:hypothetical protein
MRLICILIGLSILTGCDRKRESNSGADIFERDAVLLKNEVLHNFSSLSGQDTFRIYVTGTSILNGQFHFQIITSDASIIYAETLDTTWLLDYGAEGDTTLTAKESYIRNRIENFFNEKNFRQPAISSTEVYEADYSDKTIWDDITSDSTAIGFYYLVGKEDGRRVAYSKKLNKVVLYYNCC